MDIRSVLRAVAAVGLAISADNAMAQADDAAETTRTTVTQSVTQTGPAASSGLEEIVVTAERREERLQQVPIAISAFNTQALAREDITDATRLEQFVPNLTFGLSGADVRLAIRGARTEDVGAKSDPAIGFYVDGVYQSRTIQAKVPLVDVARIEVQRGPQGTLYGRNTFGGNLSITTNKPSEELDAGATLKVGSYSEVRAEAFVNVPLSEMFQARVAAVRQTADGFVQNTFRSNDDIFDKDQSYIRGEVRFAPNDQLEVLATGSLWADGGGGGGAFGYKIAGNVYDLSRSPTASGGNLYPKGTILEVNRKCTNTTAFCPGNIYPTNVYGYSINAYSNPTDPYHVAEDGPLQQSTLQHQATLQIAYTLDPVVLKSITSYSLVHSSRTGDNDFSPISLAIDNEDDRIETMSEELQVASAESHPLQYIAGAFLYHDNIRALFRSDRTNIADPVGGSYGPTATHNESVAGFAQVSYDVLPDVRLTGGIRYTHEEKVWSYFSVGVTNFVRQPIVSGVNSNSGKVSFNSVTYRGAVDWQVTPENLAYASISSGFRSGGFNTLNAALITAGAPAGFQPQKVTAYELGFKNRFWDNRLQANISLFYNDYSNLQTQTNQPFNGTTVSFTANAADATNKGIEAELVANPVPALTVNLTGTLQEARYGNYCAPRGSYEKVLNANGCGFVTTDGSYLYNLSGYAIPQTPDWKITGGVRYDFDLGDWGILTPQANTIISGAYYNTDFNTPIDRQGNYIKADFRLRWQSADGHYTAEAFVENAFGAAVITRATLGSAGMNISYEAPTLYGVVGSWRF